MTPFRHLLPLLLLLYCPVSALLTQSWSFTPELTYGAPLSVAPFVRGENASGKQLRRFDGYGLSLAYRPAAYPDWQKRYGFPAAAIGIRSFHLDNPVELGNPTAIFRSFRGPFYRKRGFSFDYLASVGLAAGLRRFDIDDNPYNTLVSTRLSAYVQLGVGLSRQLSPYFTLTGDVALHHFSNGNVSQPNTGLNGVAASLGVRFRPGIAAALPTSPPPTGYERFTVVNVAAYGGMERKIHWTEFLPLSEIYSGLSHPIAGLNVSVERHLNPKSALGLGISLVHRVTAPVEVTARDDQLVQTNRRFNSDNLRVGILPTYEQIFGRVSVVVQAEYYVRQKDDSRFMRRFGQKLGFRYHLGRRLYGGVFVAAHDFSVAEYVEWRVGYRVWDSR